MHAANLLDTIMTPGERSLTQEVEQCILLLLPTGRASLSAIAHALAMNLRTLQRHLEAEGDSFSALLNRVRRQQLARHLANPRLRLTDVAELLGYASLGAFTRWHIEAFGRSPSAARRALKAVGGTDRRHPAAKMIALPRAPGEAGMARPRPRGA
jgi:AraC-like DNA-binding protein